MMLDAIIHWLAVAIVHGFIYFVLFSVGIQNFVYALQLAKSIYTRHTEAMAQSNTVELWHRHAQSALAVSIIAPAFNEELTIGESIRALLTVNYPKFEVVVVNDGSPDNTLKTLIDTFGLDRINRHPDVVLSHSAIRGVYCSPNIPNLTVVDKVNGRKADAVNVGIGFARHPLMCVIDADSIIEADGMLRATEPFLNDDGSLVAVGGHIRLTNGCDVGGGQVHSVGMPSGWIERFQIVEYLRAFIVSRVASSRWNMLMLISGAFGVFRRDAVIEAGGYRHDTVGEDLELVVRLQRNAYERGRKVRVGYVPDALCWTEAPMTYVGLRNQRTRWQQGALETLERHRHMIFNHVYGRVGMIAMPLMVIEDVLGPCAELTGYVMFPVLYAVGISPLSVLLAFYALSLLFGTMLSLATLAHEELQYRPTHRVRDVAMLVLCALMENFGYRQVCAWFRLRGIYKRVMGNTSWAAVPRVGFAKKARA